MTTMMFLSDCSIVSRSTPPPPLPMPVGWPASPSVGAADAMVVAVEPRWRTSSSQRVGKSFVEGGRGQEGRKKVRKKEVVRCRMDGKLLLLTLLLLLLLLLLQIY
jgi:hypothetical protein